MLDNLDPSPLSCDLSVMAKLNKLKNWVVSGFQKLLIEEEGRNRCISCDQKLKEEDIHSVVDVRRVFCSPRCYIMSIKQMRDRQRKFCICGNFLDPYLSVQSHQYWESLTIDIISHPILHIFKNKKCRSRKLLSHY